jgi:DNA-3-methyladenine glycosylase
VSSVLHFFDRIPGAGDVLPPEFYLRPTLDVARDLLGKIFVRVDTGPRSDGDLLAGRIVEVEGYHEKGDLASHSHGGRRSRNAPMFLAGGHLYVYFTYGMHFCMNIVTEGEDVGAAVLIRALEPLAGSERMRALRAKRARTTAAAKRPVPDHALANGPAKCCAAFGIDRRFDSRPLDGRVKDGTALAVLDAPSVPDAAVGSSARIGISRSADLPWRFFLRDSRCLSRPAVR